MAEGKALVIAGIEEDIDPLLDPLLEKAFIKKGRSKYIEIGNKLCEYNDAFTFCMVTRLPNPHFSPEVQARTMVVDFTVTQLGLEGIVFLVFFFFLFFLPTNYFFAMVSRSCRLMLTDVVTDVELYFVLNYCRLQNKCWGE